MIKDSYGNTRFFGIYRGIVFKNADPLGRNRLRLKVPQIFGDLPTEWAWPSVSAGAPFVLPNNGDGVWVQFEGGDASFPIWTGSFEAATVVESTVGLTNTDISSKMPATWDANKKIIGVSQDDFDHLATVNYVKFNATATSPGSTAPGIVSWNDADGTLEFKLKDGDVTLQVGQEEVVRVVNDDSVTLAEGMVVYVSGSQGTRLKVKRADYSGDTTSAAILGVVTHSGGIAQNQEGYVTVSGLVRGLSNVRTSDGFADGEILWLAANGSWTTDKPSATDTPSHHLIQVGYVVKASNGSAGVIYVHPQNGYELEELHNVAITSPTPGQTLSYNGSLWVNSAPTAAGSSVTLSTTNFNSILSSADDTVQKALDTLDSAVPTGSIIMFGSATPPTGWLLCNGQSTTGYTALAAIVGATVPDLRNRFIVGAGSTYSQGSTGGATSHAHTLSDSGYSKMRRLNNQVVWRQVTASPSWTATDSVLGTGDTSSASSTNGAGLGGKTDAVAADSGTFLPPYYALTYIIKT